MNRSQRLLTAGLALVTLGVAWYFAPCVHAPLSRKGPAPVQQEQPPAPHKHVALPSEPEAFEARMKSAQDMKDMLVELTELARQVQDAASARRFMDAVLKSLQPNSKTLAAELVRLTPGHQRQLDARWDEVMEQNEHFSATCFNTIAEVSYRQGYGDKDLKQAYDFAMVLLMSQKMPELRAEQERVNDMLIELNPTQEPRPEAPSTADPS